MFGAAAALLYNSIVVNQNKGTLPEGIQKSNLTTSHTLFWVGEAETLHLSC